MATHYVTNSNQTGTGSITAVIGVASSGDTIEFDLPPEDNIIVISSTININKSLIIKAIDDVVFLTDDIGTYPIFNIVESEESDDDETYKITINGITFLNVVEDSDCNAITANIGDINILNCNFSKFNRNTEDRGDIWIQEQVTSLYIYKCYFKDMTGGSNGASIEITSGQSLDVNIEQCNFIKYDNTDRSNSRTNYGINITSNDDDFGINAIIKECIFETSSSYKSNAININTPNGYINTQIIDCTFNGSDLVLEDQSCLGIVITGNGSNTLEVSGCTFDGLVNYDEGGSAIKLDNQVPITIDISNTTFENNLIYGYGGVISKTENSSSIDGRISECNFLNNNYNYYSNKNGSIINIVTNNNFVFDGCTFNDNETEDGGIAIRIICSSDSINQISNSKFENNYLQTSGIFHISNSGEMIIDRCVFNSNTTSFSSILNLEMYNNSKNIVRSCSFVNNMILKCIECYFMETENNDSTSFLMENSTVSENKDIGSINDYYIFLSCQNTGTMTFTNNTITDNKNHYLTSCIYAYSQLVPEEPQIIFNNNLIANNVLSNSEGNSYIENNIGASNDTIINVNESYNNIISLDDTFFTNGVNNNQIGTTTQPLGNLRLGPLSFQGDTYVVPLLANSPAIDAGNIEKGYNGMYDQRGEYFARVIGNSIDIGAFEFGGSFVPCFDGDSVVLTRNIETLKIGKTKAKNVYAGIHEVFDIKNKQFIPVKHNAVIEGATRMILFNKDSIGPNKPNEDFKITAGHMMYVDNKEIKAKYVQGGKRIKVKSQKVYSIVTDRWTPIKINGLDVFAWSEYKWSKNTNKNGITWIENKPKH